MTIHAVLTPPALTMTGVLTVRVTTDSTPTLPTIPTSSAWVSMHNANIYAHSQSTCQPISETSSRWILDLLELGE